MKKFTLVLAIILLLCVCPFAGCKSEKVERTLYEIEVQLDGKTLRGKQSVTAYNDTETALSELKFNLFANAFRKDAKYSPVASQHTAQSYYNGVSYGDIIAILIGNVLAFGLECIGCAVRILVRVNVGLSAKYSYLCIIVRNIIFVCSIIGNCGCINLRR